MSRARMNNICSLQSDKQNRHYSKDYATDVKKSEHKIMKIKSNYVSCSATFRKHLQDNYYFGNYLRLKLILHQGRLNDNNVHIEIILLR